MRPLWIPNDLAVPITISHSTMNYRKVMTKLNEKDVTFVIQTIFSMNYFDSSRKYNGNAQHNKITNLHA